jgi:hypothetical protein
LFALHEVLEWTSLYDHVAKRKGNNWPFPGAFVHGKEMVEDRNALNYSREGHLVVRFGAGRGRRTCRTPLEYDDELCENLAPFQPPKARKNWIKSMDPETERLEYN